VVAFRLGHLQVLAPPLQPPCNHGAACCKYGTYGKFLSEVGGLISYKPNIYVFIRFLSRFQKTKNIHKLLINYLAYLSFFMFLNMCFWCIFLKHVSSIKKNGYTIGALLESAAYHKAFEPQIMVWHSIFAAL
jgi:hypothetical protein